MSDDDKKGWFDRRSFVTGTAVLAAGGLGSLVYETMTEDGPAYETPVIPKDGKKAAIARIQSLTSERWIDFDRNISIRPGGSHPEYIARKSPSFEMAIDNFHLAHLDLLPSVTVAPCLDRLELTGNLITFGSPISNDCLAALMGFERDVIDPYVLNTSEPHLSTPTSENPDFPIQFMLNRTPELLTRNSAGVQYQEPVWRIRVGDDLFSASVDEGSIASDYLVITRFALDDSGSRAILAFSGLHGPGTAATELLFENETYFDALDTAVSRTTLASHASWQALVPVARIQTIRGTDRPMEIDPQSIIVKALT